MIPDDLDSFQVGELALFVTVALMFLTAIAAHVAGSLDKLDAVIEILAVGWFIFLVGLAVSAGFMLRGIFNGHFKER